MDRRYVTRSRTPFYDVALKYLPGERDATILEIGPGPGTFIERGRLVERFPNLHVVENAGDAVRRLEQLGVPHIIQQDVTGGIPLADGSVDFLHCSHVVEHLHPREVYRLMQELDRVIKPGGIAAISAPMSNGRFYNDLSHIKPYNPDVFMDYLCAGDPAARVRELVSDRFRREELVFRYTTSIHEPFYYSPNPLVNGLLVGLRALLEGIGIRRYVKSGYTLVLRKQANPAEPEPRSY